MENKYLLYILYYATFKLHYYSFYCKAIIIFDFTLIPMLRGKIYKRVIDSKIFHSAFKVIKFKICRNLPLKAPRAIKDFLDSGVAADD